MSYLELLQESLEDEQINVGVERYRKELEGSISKLRESTTHHGRGLMSYSVDQVTKAVKEFLTTAFTGKAGRLNASASLLSLVDPEKASYLALKFAIDGVSTRQKMTKVAMMIGGAIEDEVKFRIFEDQEKAWFTRIKNEVCGRTADRHYRRYAIIHTMNKKAVIDYQAWSQQERLHVGTKMLDLIVQSTGLFEVQTHSKGRRQRNTYLVPTERTVDWITSFNERGELLSPAFMPMVVPPKPWTSIHSGGYMKDYVRPLPLIKTHNKAYLEEMEYEDMPLVYQTINVCQETAWAVNREVLSVMEYAASSGLDWGDLPAMAGHDIPVCSIPKDLAKEDMTEAQKIELTDWKRAASKVHQLNAKNSSKRIQFLRTLNMAKKFAEFNTPIHYVYQRDFRGRIYIVNPFLNFQGTGYAKSLLKFAYGAKIETREQLDALLRHGANVYGYDKAKLEDRVAFIENMKDEIQFFATDPIQFTGWTSADSPFEFLAFCFEYDKFLTEGYGFESTLICSVDGSNNGLQHLSAILRDPIGATATNLVESETQADIYTDVIKLCMERVAKDDSEFGRMWTAWGADRKCSKRPVMTRSYGSTQFSCREYIEDYIIERVAKGDQAPWGDDHFQASIYLTSFLWTAMDEIIVAAKEVMDWIQSVARLYAKENLPMTWTCPNGFVVNQMYPETKARRITTYIDGNLIKPVVNEMNYSKVDSRRMSNGGAPNVVHSLDAAALDLTVDKIIQKIGVIDLAFVHDSYGCHAAHLPIMEQALREAFVEMYEEFDILEYIYNEAKTLFGDNTPEPPAKGALDITNVLESKYFFA